MEAEWMRSKWIKSARIEMDDMHRSHGARVLRGLGLLSGVLMLGGCEAGQTETSSSSTVAAAATVQPKESRMWMTVAQRRFAITLADTEAARVFAAMLPLTMDMADLNSNEKHAKLPTALPTDARRPGTIRSGDLLLYGSDTLVVFYDTFRSSYAYTRLGWADDSSELRQALGQGEARVAFTKD
jgi:hypothetical protein